MAVINTLSSVQTNDIKNTEYWNKYLLGMITLQRENFIFSKLGVNATIPKNMGTTTISFRRYNHLPVDPTLVKQKLLEGVAPTALKVEAQKVQGTINQYGAFIEETDWVDEIHMDDIRSIYMPELARHAAEVIERDTIAMLDAEGSEYFVNSRADEDAILDTDVLTLQDVRIASLIMKNHRRSGHSKFGGKPVLVTHINVMQDLLDDEDLKDRMLVPGNENSVIKVGSLENYVAYGFTFVETLIATVTANAAATPVNVYNSYLLGRDPYAVIGLGGSNVKFLTTGFTPEKNDPLGQVATFGYKLWTGAKVLDPYAIEILKSASAYDIALFDVNDEATDDNLARPASQEVAAEG